MKRLFVIVAVLTVLMLPSLARAENHPLTDEYLDSIHAQGLLVFLDFNMFFANFAPHHDISAQDYTTPDTGTTPTTVAVDATDVADSTDSTNITDSFNNIHVTSQNIGENNSGTVLQSAVQLNDNAQQNLSSFVNINAASSVIPFGINITIIQGDNYGTVNQRNLSLGMFRSSLFMLGGI